MPYHITNIPKGVLNEFSKIQEEFLECQDAFNQNNPVMTLLELSDLIGAIEAFSITHYNVSLEDLIKMKNTTESAFKDGTRVSSSDSVHDNPPLMKKEEDAFTEYVSDFRKFFLDSYTLFRYRFKPSDWESLRFRGDKISYYYESRISPEAAVASFVRSSSKTPLILTNDDNDDKFIILNVNEFISLRDPSSSEDSSSHHELQDYINKFKTYLINTRKDINRLRLDNFIICNFDKINECFNKNISVEGAHSIISRKPLKINDISLEPLKLND